MAKAEKINTALSLITALGAYCPRVKIINPLVFESSQAAAKRRKRPLIGRGKYGAGLMSKFDDKRMEAKQANRKNRIVVCRAA